MVTVWRPVHVRLRVRHPDVDRRSRSRPNPCRRPRRRRIRGCRSACRAGSRAGRSRRCPGRRAGRWPCAREASRRSRRPRASCPSRATARAARAAPACRRCPPPCGCGRTTSCARIDVAVRCRREGGHRAHVVAAQLRQRARAARGPRAAARSPALARRTPRPGALASAVRSVRDWPSRVACQRRAETDERAVGAREPVEQVEPGADVAPRARGQQHAQRVERACAVDLVQPLRERALGGDADWRARRRGVSAGCADRCGRGRAGPVRPARSSRARDERRVRREQLDERRVLARAGARPAPQTRAPRARPAPRTRARYGRQNASAHTTRVPAGRAGHGPKTICLTYCGRSGRAGRVHLRVPRWIIRTASKSVLSILP